MRLFKSTFVKAGAIALAFFPANDALAQERGGTLRMVVNPEPSILLSALNLQTPTQMVSGKIFEGLLSFSRDLKPQPSLAKSWETSADGLTYTFHLQGGVRWHDGENFTSDDVAFTLGKMLPETSPIARATLSHIAEIQTPDATTAVVKLKEPFNAFLTALAGNTTPMMPKHIYDHGAFRTNPANANPIGTGPFKFKEWKKGEYIRLVRNDQYWEPGRPYLDEILFQVLPDEASRLVALEQGNLDVTSFTDIEFVNVKRLEDDKRFSVTYDGYEFFSPLFWIEINNRTGPLADKRYRQALMLAVDRDFIADAIWFGSARPATGPVASTTKFFEPKLPSYSFDPKKAASLLDEMGLKKDASGIRQRVRMLVPTYGTTFIRVGEYLKQALGQVGIEVTLQTVDDGTWAQRLSNWDYELALDYVFQLGHPAIGVSRTYVSTNIRKVLFANTMGYSNPKVDDLFSQAAKATGETAAQALYSEVQKALVEDVPVAWLLEIKFPTIYARRVKNLVTTAHGVNDKFDSVYISH